MTAAKVTSQSTEVIYSSTADPNVRVTGQSTEVIYRLPNVPNLRVTGQSIEILHSRVPKNKCLRTIDFNVVNPDAETGDTTGWTNETGYMIADGRFHSGTYCFGGGPNAITLASSDSILLTDIGIDAIEVDFNRVMVTVNYWQSSYASADYGSVGIRFYDANNAQIDVDHFGKYVSSDPYPEWNSRSNTFLLPKNTRSIKILFLGVRSNGTNLDFYVDDISLQATVYNNGFPHYIFNHDAETGNTAGWTVELGNLGLRTGSQISGTYTFYGENTNEFIASSEFINLIQDGVPLTEIQARRAFMQVSCKLGTYSNHQDYGYLGVRFYDEFDSIISETYGTPEVGNSIPSFIFKTESFFVPETAKKAKILIRGVKIDGVSNADAHFDDITAVTYCCVPNEENFTVPVDRDHTLYNYFRSEQDSGKFFESIYVKWHEVGLTGPNLTPGKLYGFGWNRYGQLGINSTIDVSVPTQVSTSGSWRTVVVDQTALAIKTDGTLWGWGRNTYGELGQRDNVDRSTPIQIGSDRDWVDIDTTNLGSCVALKSNGTLWAWGRNTYGQLGLDSQVENDISFGVSVALSGNGTKLVVGLVKSAATGNRGGFYTYTLNQGYWETIGPIIQSNDGTLDDNEGITCTLSDDGLMLVTGVPGRAGTGGDLAVGIVITYDWDNDNNEWVQRGNYLYPPEIDAVPQLRFGTSCCLSNDGLRLIVGAVGYNSNRGKVYIYDWNTNTEVWELHSEIIEPSITASQIFGRSCSITSNKTTIAVGSSYYSSDGAVFVYDWNGAIWASRSVILPPAADVDSSSFAVFGISCSMSDDGSVLVVGAAGIDKPDLGNTVITGIAGGINSVCSDTTTILDNIVPGSHQSAIKITTSDAVTASVTSVAYVTPDNSLLQTIISTTTTDNTYDDESYDISPPWSVEYLGQTYQNVFYGSNGYITFGAGSTSYSGLSSTNPSLPKIFIFGNDNVLTGLWTGTEGTTPNRVHRVVINTTFDYYNDLGFDKTPVTYEIRFFENAPSEIEIHFLNVAGSNITTSSLFTDNLGAVYIYNWNTGGNQWDVHSKISASDQTAGDFYGISCCTTFNGDSIVVGSYRWDDTDGSGAQNAGAVYTYASAGDTWISAAELLTQIDYSPEFYPIQVGTDRDWKQIEMNDRSTYAVKDDNSLWSWGRNYSGQLGINNTVDYSFPTMIGWDRDWKKVTAGAYGNVFALKQDGTLWSWGFNDYGQLGHNDVVSKSTPTQVGVDADWVDAATSWHTSIGLKSNGTIWAWGRNFYGELGQGHRNALSVPTQIGFKSDWKHVSVFGWGTLFINTSGELWGCGSNSYGVFDPATAPSHVSIATQIGTDTYWKSFSKSSKSSSIMGIKFI